MKHSILRKLMLIAVLLTGSHAFAHDFEVDGIYYNILSETDKTVEVTYDGNLKVSVRWSDSEIDMMREVVYPHMDDYRLLLTASQGTKHERFLHDLTEVSQARMLQYLPLLKRQCYMT